MNNVDNGNDSGGGGGDGGGGGGCDRGGGGENSHDHLCYQYKVHWEGWGKKYDSVVSHDQLAR